MKAKDRIKRKLIEVNFPLYNRIQIMHQNLNYYLYRKDTLRYKTIGIFDIDKIPQRYFYYRIEKYPHNSFYGIEKTIREYAGWHKPVNAFIEHGIADKADVEEKEYYLYKKPVYITFGNMRESAIKNRIKTNVVKIGPYICYAKPWYTEEDERRIKERYGKILTVFPSHTIEGWNVNYSVNEFCNEINRCKKELKIDTVFLCGYWYDIVTGRLDPYSRYDFVWVSAGHAMDQDFLSKLKSIIRLSDYTMSNRFGTHVGYSLALNKPHYIFEEKWNAFSEDGNLINRPYFDEEKNEFDDFQKFNTPEQRKVVEDIFGLSEIRTPEDMRGIFEKL